MKNDIKLELMIYEQMKKGYTNDEIIKYLKAHHNKIVYINTMEEYRNNFNEINDSEIFMVKQVNDSEIKELKDKIEKLESELLTLYRKIVA